VYFDQASAILDPKFGKGLGRDENESNMAANLPDRELIL